MADGSLLEQRGVTRREAEVLDALGERLTNAEIAARLYVSERTVESHVSALLRKLDAANRVALAAMAKSLASAADLEGPRLPAPLELLADPGRYVGRAGERELLRSLWSRASAGHVLAAVVTGDAGIGKSRLVAELAAEIHPTGAHVLLGSCFEDVQAHYQPFVQAIRDDLANVSDTEATRRAGAGAAALARIIPELSSRLGLQVGVGGDVVDAAAERADVLAALHAYLCRAAEAAPVLLVIEDLHWATGTTRDALRHLARLGGHAPVLVIATARDTAPDRTDALDMLLADLYRLPAVTPVALSGLDDREVQALVASLDAPVPSAALRADTGGNPLFVLELAGTGGQASMTLPGLLARRNARLGADDGPTLDMAAVLGTEFDADLLASCVDGGLTDVLESLERAESAGLVSPSPGRPGRFSFSHGLFRTARYGAIPASRRLGLHQRAAWALRARSEDDRVLPELARHACLAAPLGEARAAVDYARRAGDLAEQALALEEAAAHYRRALEAADLLDPPDPRTRLALTVRLGELLYGAGDPDHRRVLREAAASARALGDAHALADIAWAMVHFGFTANAGTSDPEFVALAEEALTGLGPDLTAARARTLAALSADLLVGGHPMRAFYLAEEALVIARRLDDPVTLAHVLLAYRFSARTPDNAQARHPASDELIAIGRATGQPIVTMLGLHNRAWSYREQGDLAASDEAFAAAEAMRGGQPLPASATGAAYLAFRAARHVLAGDLDAAERTAGEIVALAGGQGFDPINWYGPAMMVIRYLQGRAAELLDLVELAARQPGVDDVYTAGLALARAQAGHVDDARAVLAKFAEQRFAGIRPNLFWLTAVSVLGDAAELSGDRDAAALLLPMLAPYSGRIADLPPAVIGPVDLVLAQLALTVGDPARAEALAAGAVAASRRRDTPIFLGRELIRLAEARRRLGAAGPDVDALVDEALAIAASSGAGAITHDASLYGWAGGVGGHGR